MKPQSKYPPWVLFPREKQAKKIIANWEKFTWKEVPETLGEYCINENAVVWSRKHILPIKPCLGASKRPQITLHVRGKFKRFSLSRLVADLFLKERPLNTKISFKNGNRIDCRAANLEFRKATVEYKDFCPGCKRPIFGKWRKSWRNV